MCCTVRLCHHQILLKQLFQLCFTGVLHLNFTAKYFLCAELKQLFRKYSIMTQWRSATHSMSLCQYNLICLDGNV